ncbi:MAG: hypothetical protein A2498_02155 [Lentisphaerae bacterium RIFOXYC12_FULL_60_16]|nr:MAG: hypothetical protein A2498_02155 [Lentisphaerae bacterium RIFOXYC12_FULL_60_16]
MVEPVDQADWAAYRDGEEAALERLIERHRGPLFGYLVNMCRNTADAEELFQDVWLKVIRKPEAFRGGNLGGWLMRVAHNLVIDRSRKRTPDLTLDVTDEAGERPLIDRVASPEATPAEALAAGDLGRQIERAVATLPPDQREVFLMRVESDLPFKEIARIQKVSINTALARMQYALNKLRPLMAAG